MSNENTGMNVESLDDGISIASSVKEQIVAVTEDETDKNIEMVKDLMKSTSNEVSDIPTHDNTENEHSDQAERGNKKRLDSECSVNLVIDEDFESQSQVENDNSKSPTNSEFIQDEELTSIEETEKKSNETIGSTKIIANEDAAESNIELNILRSSTENSDMVASKNVNGVNSGLTVIEIDDEEDDPTPKLEINETVETDIDFKDQNKIKKSELSSTFSPMQINKDEKKNYSTKTENQKEQHQQRNDDSPNEKVENESNDNVTTIVTKQTKTIQESLTSDENILLTSTSLERICTEPNENENQIDSRINDYEIYLNKECINIDCSRKHKQFFRSPEYVLNFFKVAKKKHTIKYVCMDCYDIAINEYEKCVNLLSSNHPVLYSSNSRLDGGDVVEIIDSSEDEDTDDEIKTQSDLMQTLKNDNLQLIESELNNTIRSVLNKVNIQNQMTWCKSIMNSRLKQLQDQVDAIDSDIKSFQTKGDIMYSSLYSYPRIKIKDLPPLDLNVTDYNIPPPGEIRRAPIRLHETYYAVKNKAIASWVPCQVIEEVECTIGLQKDLKYYKVKFFKSPYQLMKIVSIKHLAYYEPYPHRLPVGSRVIAYFDATSLHSGKEKIIVQSAFYPGIIAEPIKASNKYRYLIFYDDGYTQYVPHDDVRLVCHVSTNVWDDIHPGSRDFIEKYLVNYSVNRPMVQTQKGQSMTTESNGKWIYARVIDIDCSLIQMQFEGPKNHKEWIYRGSMRLGPVFKEYQKTYQKDKMPINRVPRRTEPFIRYTADEEAATSQMQQRPRQNESRAVAKKSITRPTVINNGSQQQTSTSQVSSRYVSNYKINDVDDVEIRKKPTGKVIYYTAKKNLPTFKYQPHCCNPSCLFIITHNLSAYSPLSKPLLSGWERLFFNQKIKKNVAYRAPCGRMLRNIKEVHYYLRQTKCKLNVENFDFSPETNCLAEYVIESYIRHIRDISHGKEKMLIPLVNYYDNTLPSECVYETQRIPTEGVHLNLDEEFLVGCDCEDDCSNKDTCSCWQLTLAGAKYGNPNIPLDEVGYQYKRLYDQVLTGIYECNSRCKCKSNCLNRVVQHSLEMKLQIFKTSNRGWGLRCINDVPRGSFICIYAGHLLTEAKANEGGMNYGDEYLAELDYIEVVEQMKEGYESDVEIADPEEDEDDDDDFTPSKSYLQRSKNKKRQEEESQERQVINFNPNADMNENSIRESSMRQLFGKDEACYVMDAKIAGNLGRYFNHSCSPNLFVQNVFVDTHDLRFPWVAFFASQHIRAGSELTWNYNYEVGVVPGKVLYCHCGADACRGRLL